MSTRRAAVVLAAELMGVVVFWYVARILRDFVRLTKGGGV